MALLLHAQHTLSSVMSALHLKPAPFQFLDSHFIFRHEKTSASQTVRLLYTFCAESKLYGQFIVSEICYLKTVQAPYSDILVARVLESSVFRTPKLRAHRQIPAQLSSFTTTMPLTPRPPKSPHRNRPTLGMG
ncbi:hypothetical protein CYLTODRAFT_140815 [Cylindrobasidium torrendii FP15055 ss-10]|uniref:Uncharacterized protein n=1 Tax=Cylindrobasidium torrendii FP15055 ss-10 TaxID=1314674 RepID=A0A0D7AYS0_9AGAR|nr:hypothetical protein CYLTODRAFT_140815 [Cylindrobasidium torrendii FP15055 ss-10]